MASDVEVLRLWLQSFESHPSSMPVLFPSMEQLSALSSAIVALEAREAQPKVEGRMPDDVWELHDHALCDSRTCVHAEAGRARASEAALSERVAALSEALEPFAAIGRHLREAGYPSARRRGGLAEDLHSFAFVPGKPAVSLRQADCFRAADVLSPPSKPETP